MFPSLQEEKTTMQRLLTKPRLVISITLALAVLLLAVVSLIYLNQKPHQLTDTEPSSTQQNPTDSTQADASDSKQSQSTTPGSNTTSTPTQSGKSRTGSTKSSSDSPSTQNKSDTTTPNNQGTPTQPDTNEEPEVQTFPNASTTGVPAGTTLSNCPSSTWNTESNVTYTGCDFTGGYYTFTGNNITIRNSQLLGGVLFYGDSIILERSTISGIGVNLSGTGTVNLRYNRIYNFTSDAIHITADTGSVTNVTLTGNYIHSPTPQCGAHADGLQVRGVTGLLLDNNSFDMGPWAQVCGQDALNAALFFEDANGGNSGITVRDNYLNGGGFIVYFDESSGQIFKDNAFGSNGEYGYAYPGSDPSDFSDRTGNYILATGSPLTF